MGNALQRAELRPQSFNGLFRWWFRTAGGSLNDEKRLFGWTGNTSNKGLVQIRIINQNTQIKTFHKEFSGNHPAFGSGLNYLGFALDPRFKKNDYSKTQRTYITGNFIMEILFHPFATEEDIDKFFATLWLSINLGNFGSRSRRCFGSIRTDRIEPLPKTQLQFIPNLQNLSQWIKENLNEIVKIVNAQPRMDIPFIKNFEIFKVNKNNWKNYKSWIKEVQKGRNGTYLVSEWYKEKNSRNSQLISKPIDLCDFMGFLMQAYRSYYEPDYTNAKNIISRKWRKFPTVKATIERAGFGLPLPFYFSSLRRRGTVNLIMNQATTRRASPLLFKVLSNGENFEGLFIYMKSKFKPEKASVKLEGIEVKPKEDIVRDFLKSLEKHSIVQRIT